MNLGIGNSLSPSEPCVHIACGNFHNAVVTQSGKVYCWGSSSDGQCGTGSLDRVHVPTLVPIEINKGFCQHGVPKPATSVDVETVACGASHTLALSCGKFCTIFSCSRIIIDIIHFSCYFTCICVETVGKKHFSFVSSLYIT